MQALVAVSSQRWPPLLFNSMEITLDKNLENMRECSKFESCDIPKCPLDFWADKRIQLKEDKRCPNWKYVGVKTSKKDREGHIMPSLKQKVRFVGEQRKQNEKTTTPKAI